MRLTETVKQLLIINIIMFIGTSLSGDLAYSLFGLHFPKLRTTNSAPNKED